MYRMVNTSCMNILKKELGMDLELSKFRQLITLIPSGVNEFTNMVASSAVYAASRWIKGWLTKLRGTIERVKQVAMDSLGKLGLENSYLATCVEKFFDKPLDCISTINSTIVVVVWVPYCYYESYGTSYQVPVLL